MSRRRPTCDLRWIWPRAVSCVVVAVACGGSIVPHIVLPHRARAQAPELLEHFEARVRPLLSAKCWQCHGEVVDPKGGLKLTSREALLVGGDRGPAIVPGDPESSLLIQAVRHDPAAGLKMPKSGRLDEAEIAALELWIRSGAPWPASTAAADSPDGWPYNPVVEHAPPVVRNESWPANDIDRFLLARIEAAGLEPAPPADKRTLLRRVTYDLVGLPPTPDELAAFLADDSPEAYGKVVERLLASPRYGERWGRHWLDVVRFSETNGQDIDRNKPHAYRYRDYVIQAFNDDVPYDVFVREHLAGDLMDPPRMAADGSYAVSPLGSAFAWLGEFQNMPVDMAVAEAAELEGQLDAFGKAFLGLTIACARCHDHKFDPLTTNDYYALGGFFASTQNVQACLDAPSRQQRISQVRDELLGVQGKIDRLCAKPRALRIKAQIEQLPAYLLAVQELLVANPEPDESEIERLAGKLKLDARRLQRWVEFLLAAEKLHDPIWFPYAALAKASPNAFKPTAQALYWRSVDWTPPDPAATGLEPLHLFEGRDYGDWQVAGQAFGSGPWQGPPLDWSQPGRQGYSTSAGVDALTGRVTSPPFTVKKRFLSMFVAGGDFPYKACVNVKFHSPLVQEADDYTATGENTEQFTLRTMDVQPFVGRQAIIEVVDQVREPGGHIAATGFYVSDEPPVVQFPPNPLASDLLWPADVKTFADLAGRTAALFQSVVDEWISLLDAGGEMPTALPSREREGLRRWVMTEGGLLDAADEDLPATLARELPELAGLLAQQKRLLAELPESMIAIVTRDRAPRDLHVHQQGNPHNEGELAPRGFPKALTGGAAPPPLTGSGRLQLAEWVASRNNPLTARVMVNRLWRHHFGRGIVATTNNFGVQGDRPTHPELLDYLAARFMAGGWSIKAMHRLMVKSRAYQQSSVPSERALEVDPDNKLLSHATAHRLDAECVRDALLAVAGNLNDAMFGPSVPLHVTKYMRGDDLDLPRFSGPMDGDRRRSVYLEVRRNHLTPLLAVFDFPKPDASIGDRLASTVPAQALAMLNNEFVHAQAGVWARRLLADATEPTSRIERMFVEAFSRLPTADETAALVEFVRLRTVENATADPADAELQAWTAACHAVFNLAEFTFVE